jgi:competence protein ComEA
MKIDKMNMFWLIATGALVFIIIVSSLTIWLSADKSQPISISTSKTPQHQGEIYIDGAVGNPGRYPLKSGDSLDTLLKACGGENENADLSRIFLYFPAINNAQSPQKIDINRAEIWLLEALPNIAEVKAQAICEYRRQNGLFRNIEDITHVPGINNTTFEKIKGLITVAEFH